MSSDEEEVGGAAAAPAAEGEQTVTDLRNTDVVTKYQEAAKIVNLTIKGVALKCTAGTDVATICKFGDQLIRKQCERIYKTAKDIEKGIAFPTCVSVNEIVCHYSPLDGESRVLAANDVVKIDLAVHIDGFIVTAAHTLVVGATDPVEGPVADVLAALACGQAVAHRLVVAGKKNSEVTAALKQVAADFGVSLVQGVLSHQMKRFVIDGNKVVIGREEVDQKVDENSFETYEVYALDLAFSTGEGKPRQADARTTVFKRALDQTYKLKRKSSRWLFGKLKDQTLAFGLRDVEDQTQAKAGIVECVSHNLLVPYPVLEEKQGAVVGHAKMTLLLMPSGTIKITGNDLPPVAFKTSKEPSEPTQAILSLSVGKKKRKKNNKKKAGGAAAEGGGGGGGEAKAE